MRFSLTGAAIAAMHEKENGPPVIRFGPFTLDGRSGELRNGPTRLKVPDQSIAVLQALLERPGELVTREAAARSPLGPRYVRRLRGRFERGGAPPARGAQRFGRRPALYRDAAPPRIPVHRAR